MIMSKAIENENLSFHGKVTHYGLITIFWSITYHLWFCHGNEFLYKNTENHWLFRKYEEKDCKYFV